jgi:hypothetical protein
MVVTDRLTKGVELEGLHDISAEAVAQRLLNAIILFMVSRRQLRATEVLNLYATSGSISASSLTSSNVCEQPITRKLMALPNE